VISLIALGARGSGSLALIAVYGLVATALVGVGVYRLVKAQRIYLAERTSKAGTLPGS
jgi:hypothetical protein